MKLLSNIILFTFFICNIYSQQKTSEGYLLKINFYQSTIDTNLIVAHWKSIQNAQHSSSEIFEKVFTVDSSTYFVKRTDSQSYGSFFPGSYQTILINSQTNKETNLFSSYYPECGTDIYISSSTNITAVNSGMILNNNLSRTTYNFSAEGIYNLCEADSGMKIVHVVGKLNSRYLVVVRDDNFYLRYFLEDFNNTWLKPAFTQEVKFSNIYSTFSPAPNKTYNLTDSLLIMSFDWPNNILITNFSDSVITKVDSLEMEPMPFWTYKNNRLYFVDDSGLCKKEFNEHINRFDGKEAVLKVGNDIAVDVNENYFTTIYSDTLFIYSLAEDKLVNKIEVRALHDYLSILIDPPFIYINKLDRITSTKAGDSLISSFGLYQNYPNPFNPETTIQFSIPNVETIRRVVSLKIYDMLGREVAVLVNEEKAPGNYGVQFNGSALASGIYFYTLNTGNHSITKKMILLR